MLREQIILAHFGPVFDRMESHWRGLLQPLAISGCGHHNINYCTRGSVEGGAKGDDQTVKRHLADRRIPENRWELIETGLRDAQR